MFGIIFRRFGPYHRARLNALARGAHRSVVGIEIDPADTTYAWSRTSEALSFRHVVVCRNEAERSGSELWRRVFAVLDEQAPGALAVPGWADPAALAGLAWARQKGVPVILMSDSTALDEPRHWWKEAIKSRILRMADVALVAGTRQEAYLVDLGFPRQRIFQGYDVIDNDHFISGSGLARQYGDHYRAALGLPDQYFLASARFVSKKNLFRLIDAYARYRDSVAGETEVWDLVILGDGPLRVELEGYISSAGVAGSVHLPGFRQYDELPTFYGLAGAFVHASTTDQWGLVVNEAMASGLPLIVSERCGCAPDLVVHGENGFVFDPYDEQALARYMLHIADEDCDRVTMGETSRSLIDDWALEVFSLNLVKAADLALWSPRRRRGLVERGLLWGLARR